MKSTVRNKKQKGFTLIELLVVIAIIGLLASIVLVALSAARKNGRNAKRIADMSQIRKALEFYYDDNGKYPDDPAILWRTECDGSILSSSAVILSNLPANQVIPGLVPKYMATFPSDPGMNKATFSSCYIYLSNGINYKLDDFGIADNSQSDYLKFSDFIDPKTNPLGSEICGMAPDPSRGIQGWSIYSFPLAGSVNPPACW